jgi:hypothetical protein
MSRPWQDQPSLAKIFIRFSAHQQKQKCRTFMNVPKRFLNPTVSFPLNGNWSQGQLSTLSTIFFIDKSKEENSLEGHVLGKTFNLFWQKFSFAFLLTSKSKNLELL